MYARYPRGSFHREASFLVGYLFGKRAKIHRSRLKNVMGNSCSALPVFCILFVEVENSRREFYVVISSDEERG